MRHAKVEKNPDFNLNKYAWLFADLSIRDISILLSWGNSDAHTARMGIEYDSGSDI